FQYIEADFLRGRSFTGWDDLARQAKHWLDTIANRRTHGTTKLVPDEVWETTERSFLVKLPSYPFTRYPEETREVGPDCVISVLGTRFSVPSRFAQQEVRVRILSDRFEVVERSGAIVASHPLSQEQHGKLVIDPKHYEEVRRDPERRRGPARLEESFLARFPAAAAFLDGLKARMRGLFPIHLRTLVRLADRFGDGPLASAVRKACDFRNFNAEAVRRILEREFPLLAHETMAPPASGATLALGAVEEVPAFGDYDHLDADISSERTRTDPEKPASEEADDAA
ncbi:MAG: Mu transposase domain-containing protein, partial [Vicinamibacteria bacterium]